MKKETYGYKEAWNYYYLPNLLTITI